ncbi:MAG: redox-sensing transcriptional repressor Rex [Chitinivibrionales bacterium]|nr:redox-sensing transcriptional repressor Rex [Chitinivibrionales bacterium]
MAHNRNSVLRLSRYKNALYTLKRLGFVRVFSDNLADATGVSPARVRKDFSLFGITGNRRGGYRIDELIERVNDILGKNRIHNCVVIGAGKIGKALLSYGGLQSERIRVVAGFDIDPRTFKRRAKVPVLPLDELEDVVRKHNVRVGIIAVPEVAAQQAFDLLVSAGVEGILNFAPVGLIGPDNVVVTNVNLAAELENLIYFINVADRADPDATSDDTPA